MSLLTRTDVTAVKLCPNIILAGIGSALEITERKSGHFVHKVTALHAQKIYGIVPSHCYTKLLIFGGKQFTIFLIKDNKMVENESILTCHRKTIICDDWLHSGIWISKHMIALLTAHNIVQIWNIQEQLLVNQYVNPDNSILYSGLLLQLQDNILVFSGTVFSEVILQCCSDDKPLKRLTGHKGVIFSISCNPDKGLIVTTSDDRSVRIWNVKNSTDLEYKVKEYWQGAKIICTHELYGHSARVMRNSITNDYVISVGEDSGICFWNHEGKLLRKTLSHQNASIWSLDADDNHLVTGGSDSSVVLHPLSLLTAQSNTEIINVELAAPKKIEFTARGNIIIMNESNTFIYHNLLTKQNKVHVLNHDSTYKLLSLSICKQIIAVVDMTGNLAVFIENCKGDPDLTNIIDTKLDLGKILSMQWATNRHLVLCSDNGFITVLTASETDIEIFANFSLPPCKERWLTCSSYRPDEEIFVVSDRCGHIHIYYRGSRNPIKSFDKVHGRYGATTITITNNQIITTGRDGTIKYFSLENKDVNKVKYMSSRELNFPWVEKFLDKNQNYICGFQERVFIVYDIINNMKLLEVNCGGGHRSWDAICYFDKVDNILEKCIRLAYIKNYNIHLSTFQLSKIVSKTIIYGTHPKEINCLKTYTCDNNTVFYISGGEDTTLRISISSEDLKFRDKIIFKHLSNIRSLKILQIGVNRILLISAGGRAQICIKQISFLKTDNSYDICCEELVNHLIKGTDKERKGNRNWRNCAIDFDPETRIMDIEIINTNDNEFCVYAGCSDGILRIYNFEKNTVDNFKLLKEIKHHETCILKMQIFNFKNREVLVTCTTRGQVSFWDVKTLCTESLSPIYSITTNKSGINSLDVKSIDDTKILLATGGDDNAVHLNIIEIENDDLNTMKVCQTWSSDKFHCSQITGLKLIDDLMITTSIDQRITLFNISAVDTLICNFVSQLYSDISDIQGIDILKYTNEYIEVCVFGKGIEALKIPRTVQK